MANAKSNAVRNRVTPEDKNYRSQLKKFRRGKQTAPVDKVKFFRAHEHQTQAQASNRFEKWYNERKNSPASYSKRLGIDRRKQERPKN